MNGQEKTDEIAGSGNHTTALFWEYDTRLIRRWNLDPKPNPSISDYAAFANNPIWFSDPLGDTIRTNQEGFSIINEGLNATLGKANPFGFDEKKGLLTFDRAKFNSNSYDDTQSSIIANFSYLIDSDRDIVNVFVVDYKENFYTEKNGVTSLKRENAIALNTDFLGEKPKLGNSADDYTKTTQNVFLPRVPKDAQGELPFYYRGLSALHEIGGHAFYNQIGGIKISTQLHNNFVELFEDKARTIYIKDNGKPIGGKSRPHLQTK